MAFFLHSSNVIIRHHETSWNVEANGDLLALAASRRDSQCLILESKGFLGSAVVLEHVDGGYHDIPCFNMFQYLVHPGPHALFHGYPTLATCSIVPAGL